FIQTLADDGVKVEADGKWLIDRWGANTNEVDRALWLAVSAGTHNVKTHLLELTGGASIYSDIVPLNTWLAYYYANENLEGRPTATEKLGPKGEYGQLEKNYGNGSPKSGVPANHFSASYTTAKKLTAGEYVIRANADDGVRVYIDGKLVLDRWTASLNQEDA
ncbi:TPA: hypothetical protein M4455_003141, partial [Legionella pneumophila]|nr:hypothetical protein [Legionella pneumophila]